MEIYHVYNYLLFIYIIKIVKYLNEPKPFLDIFRPYGEIESYRFRSVPVTGVPIEKYDQKVLRKASIIKSAINEEVGSMNAYIVYKNEESVEKALVENEKEYDSHHIRVDRAIQSNHKQEKNRTIFIGNLPFSITNEELRDFLYKNLDKDECEIENLRIVRDENTNQSKGIAYVVFKDEMAMSEALLLNGSTFKDRQIRISKWKAITKRKDKNEKFNASNIVNMKNKNKKFKGNNNNNNNKRKNGDNNGKVRNAKRVFTNNKNNNSGDGNNYSGKKTRFNPKSNIMKKITEKLKKNKSSKPGKGGNKSKSNKSNRTAFKKKK